MNNDELAKRIAREIFLVGEDRGDQVHRIQFMCGNLQVEWPAGGLGESSLAAVIRRVLHAVEGKP